MNDNLGLSFIFGLTLYFLLSRVDLSLSAIVLSDWRPKKQSELKTSKSWKEKNPVLVDDVYATVFVVHETV
jgi:hypothetical protein